MDENPANQSTQKSTDEPHWKQALARLEHIRASNRWRGVYHGDLVAEVRAEREAQLDRVMFGSSEQ